MSLRKVPCDVRDVFVAIRRDNGSLVDTLFLRFMDIPRYNFLNDKGGFCYTRSSVLQIVSISGCKVFSISSILNVTMHIYMMHLRTAKHSSRSQNMI